MRSQSMSDGMVHVAVRLVLVPAGAMALTRTGVFINSMASARVSCTTAPLVMQYTTV